MVSQICVYCLAPLTGDTSTADHVIARSWYPRNTPSVAKWKAPACQSCNNKFSRIEEDLLHRLAMCLDSKNPQVAHIVAAARRAIDPSRAKSPRDAMRRFNRREAMRQSAFDVTSPNAPGVLPFSRENFAQGSRTGLLVPADLIKGVVGKWIRGIHFCELGTPVPDNYVVSAILVEDEVAEQAYAEVARIARRLQKGVGIDVVIAHGVDEQEFATLYGFQLWQQFRVYGSVGLPERDAAVGL